MAEIERNHTFHPLFALLSLYTSIAYTASFASFEECRSSHLPSAVVPPELLKLPLKEIEEMLSESVELAIPSTEVQRYYKLPFAESIHPSIFSSTLTLSSNCQKIFKLPGFFIYSSPVCPPRHVLCNISRSQI